MFVALPIISISYDNIVLTRVITEMWKHDEITTVKFDRPGNEQTCYEQANSIARLA